MQRTLDLKLPENRANTTDLSKETADFSLIYSPEDQNEINFFTSIEMSINTRVRASNSPVEIVINCNALKAFPDIDKKHFPILISILKAFPDIFFLCEFIIPKKRK